MKNAKFSALLMFTFLLIGDALPVQAASWFVSPKGDDAANGTIERPFATVQRAQRDASPGDIVFLRGGTYRMTEDQIAHRRRIFAYITVLDKSGARGNPITYCAFENEKPVFDCSQVKPEGMRVDAFHITGLWLHLKGFAVTGVQVTIKGHTQSICFESNGSHNVFERLQMHDGQAIGIYHIRGIHNLSSIAMPGTIGITLPKVAGAAMSMVSDAIRQRINNSAFRNGTNFNMLGRLADNHTDVDGYGHKLHNNLSYRSRGGISKIDTTKCDLANNSFLPDLKLGDQDFLNLEERDVINPRQADGGLPAIRFLHPASNRQPVIGAFR